MRPDDLIKPVTPDAPCGEDLLAADDPDFVDYYFNVEDRFPTSYFNVVRGTLFDPKTIDAKAEAAQIESLLKRSRDLRLLGIDAKFQALSGRFKGFVDAVTGMAALLEAYPNEVHPVDPLDRRNAIEELNAMATIVSPLEYMPLFNDKRIGDVVFRPYATGSGKITPREGEEPGNASAVTGALGSAENAKLVDTLFQQLTSLQAALKTMTAACLAGPQPTSPKFDRIEQRLRDLVDMVLIARPDLGGSSGPAVEVEGAAASGGAAVSSTGFTILATPQAVPDHRSALRQLQTVERYFVANEPSSLALLLVVQARLLVGRPLVEALDALMESSAGYAKVDLGNDTGFSLSMTRLRELSDQANIPATEAGPDAAEDEGESARTDADGEAENEGEAAAVDSPAPPPPSNPAEVLSRDHAGMVLKQVEEFFQIREPASPIPILLFKARNMLSKDFHALVRELIPPAN